MKKLSLLKLFTILLWGGVLLQSCNNFLDGGDFKDQLEKDIAYANAKECTLVVKSNPNTGNFLSEGEKKCKVGYTIDLQFNADTSSCIFKTLEAVSTTDQSISRNDCVEFTQTEGNDKTGVYKITVKLLKEANDILIRPVCTELPAISGITPKFESAGCEQNTSIKITFNKPVNQESFGDFSCITITDGNENLADYFDTPYFSSDDLSLIIQPKADIPLINPNGSKQNLDISLRYNFSEAKDAEGFSIAASGTHEYRVNKTLKEQKKVNIQIKSEEALGTFSPAGEKECVVGYTLDLQFKLNKKSYYFDTFEAVSSSGSGESRAASVSFGEIERDDENGIYKIQVRVIEEASDILIQPVCIALPAVTGHKPSSSDEINYANVPIEVTFNMSVESETVSNSQFTYKNIYLTSNGEDVSSYFEKPAFNETKNVLTIVPKSLELKKFIKTAYIEVEVNFAGNISVQNGDKIFFLTKNEDSVFTVRYKGTLEEEPPVRQDFFVSWHEFNLETKGSLSEDQKFTQEDFADDDREKIFQNRTNGTVYIYGRYYDADSGVKKVQVTEQLTDFLSVTEPVLYTSDNAEFYSAGGYTDFCIKHELKSDDGKIQINAQVFDTAGNAAEVQNVKAIKRSRIELSREPKFSNTYKVINYNNITEESITKYNEGLKKIWLFNSYYECELYGGYYFAPTDLSLYLEYTDKDSVLRREQFEYFTNPSAYYESEKEGWTVEIKNIDSVDGMKMKFFLYDDMENCYEKELEILPQPTINFTKKETYHQDSSNNFILGVFATFLSDSDISNAESYIIRRTISDNTLIYGSEVPELYRSRDAGKLDVELADGYSYRFMLIKDGLSNSIGNTEVKASDYDTTLNMPEIELDGDSQYQKNTENGYINVTLKFKSNNWNYYDSIIITKSYKNERGNVIRNKATIEKGTLSYTFTLPTYNLYNQYDTAYISLVGTKGSQQSTNKLVYFTNALNGKTEYDNCPPTIGDIYVVDDLYPNCYTLTVNDVGAGLQKTYIIPEEGEPIFFSDRGDTYIPKWYAMQHYISVGDNAYLNVGAVDKAGNTTEAAAKLPECNPAWNKYDKNTGDYDLILPNGSSKTSVAISSDAPVFAYMLSSTSSASNASNWKTVEDWESKDWIYVNRTAGKFLSFSPTDHSPKKFDFSADAPTTSNTYYCVIVHFSDGSTAMSEIMKK